ncbi:putative Ig domain-containing protein, partial [Novilysobacter erysipheiresistens]
MFSCAINTPPTPPTIHTQYVKEELSFTKTLPAFGDINGHALSYSLSGLPGGVVFNASTRVISGKPTVPGNYTLTYTANDGYGGVTAKTFTLVVQANTRPTAPAIPNHSITNGQAWSYYVPAFSDPNNDPLTYTATGLPPGLGFTASNRRISGTPSQTGTWTVTVTANDGRGGVTSKGFTITVKAAPIPNRAPVLSYPLPDRAVNGGNLLDYTFSINSFTDPDGNALTYTAKLSNGAALPSWLSFNASQRRFTGVPPNPSVDYAIDIRVTATDPKGLSASDVFQVRVRAVSGGGGGGGGGGGPYGPLSVSQPLSFDMGQAVAPDMVVLDPVEPSDLSDAPSSPDVDSPAEESAMLPAAVAAPASLVAPELTEYWYTYDAENRLKIHNGTLSGGRILANSAYE